MIKVPQKSWKSLQQVHVKQGAACPIEQVQLCADAQQTAAANRRMHSAAISWLSLAALPFCDHLPSRRAHHSVLAIAAGWRHLCKNNRTMFGSPQHITLDRSQVRIIRLKIMLLIRKAAVTTDACSSTCGFHRELLVGRNKCADSPHGPAGGAAAAR